MYKSIVRGSHISPLLRTQTQSFSKMNSGYIPNTPEFPPFKAKNNMGPGLASNHRSGDWTLDEVKKSTQDHVVFTWGATDPMRNGAKDFKRGEGVYLYDYAGKKYIDMSSQAINNNLGYTIPESVLSAITKQLTTLHMVYGGLTLSEPKAKLAQILNDITPADITGFVFPCTGSEANEVAIRAARRFTGK